MVLIAYCLVLAVVSKRKNVFKLIDYINFINMVNISYINIYYFV